MTNLALSFIAALATGCAIMSGSVLYSNGPSNQMDGANMSSYAVADDFGVSSSVTIQQISIFSSADSDPFPDFSNPINWAILSDSSGTPGISLATGSSSVSFNDTGLQILGTEEYQLTFATLPTSLSAGSYWLGLTVDTSGNLSQSIYWDTTSQVHGAVAMASADTSFGGPWTAALSGLGGTDLAFVLSGSPTDTQPTPEISTFLATIVGFAFIIRCCARSRKRAAEKRINAGSVVSDCVLRPAIEPSIG